ncbi:MAG: class I SAM-dependent methyltransferase [Coriobacteriia bacterium]
MSQDSEAKVQDYDEFVDWDKRLANEGPFYRRLFEDAGVQRVIDMGAGSARHSIMFASWGLEVIAVDPDESMLAAARRNIERFAEEIAAGGGSVRLERGEFGELHAMNLGLADALVCAGNALPHVDGRDGLTETLADFGSVIAPGGVLVLHLLNHARLLRTRSATIPTKVRAGERGTKVFLRIVDFPEGDAFIDFDFVTLVRDTGGSWSLTNRRSPHTVITADILAGELPCCGFAQLQVYGDHTGRPLDVGKDESIIAVARRR